MKSEKDRETNAQNGERCGMFAGGQAGNDVCGMASLRRVRNFFNRSVIRRRVIIRKRNDDGRHDQADQRCEIKLAR